ncbi:hypothetical protein ACN6LM_006797 [Streptomyces sp. SAS_281]|uniref:hypothetical protein n=1 Tax=Streptomyces sp. SAS_281 TaxID=3412744 RepID=UPI00403CC6D8
MSRPGRRPLLAEAERALGPLVAAGLPRRRAFGGPHAVDHPGQDASLAPQRSSAAVVQAHQQASMSAKYLESRTTDPATWLRTPKNLDRLAACMRTADTRHRGIEARPKPEQPAVAVKPPDQQHHANRPDQAATQ